MPRPASWIVLGLWLTLLLPWNLAHSADREGRSEHRNPPEWSRNVCIYEVNVRQFTPAGTFAEFREHLPRLKELGVRVLWFMPIHPIGEQNRKGTLGSYYSVRDYLAVNPEFGTMDEFKSLVRSAHDLGMHVLIDWVANHAAWDNPLVEEHPDWFTQNEKGDFVPPVPDWHDVIDLNYEREGLRDYMIEAMRFWIRETDIDGFRCDVAGMVPWDFWADAIEALHEIKPVFMLAEDESPAAHEKGFDVTYSWNLHWLMSGIAHGKRSVLALDSLFIRERNAYPPDAHRLRFTDNHDENSWNGTVFERLGDAAEAFAVLTLTVPGIPLIYSGQEAGLDKQLEFFERDPIDWREHHLRDVYRILLRLKRENRALWNGSSGGAIVRCETNLPETVSAFVREKDDQDVLVVLNLSAEPKLVEVKSRLTGEFLDAFTGERVNVSENAPLELGAWGYRVLSR
ncbi:alpha-glucosidase C-terminal domain-containing protein [bacterium]|nr:alpha-glucosidase C-terminal domain-containing protein [bacterium]MBU1984422.1 alpha-glucosidase C-terminal domain-containing protein [bacterium]